MNANTASSEKGRETVSTINCEFCVVTPQCELVTLLQLGQKTCVVYCKANFCIGQTSKVKAFTLSVHCLIDR